MVYGSNTTSAIMLANLCKISRNSGVFLLILHFWGLTGAREVARVEAVLRQSHSRGGEVSKCH